MSNVGIAIIGSGIFVREEHLPGVLKSEHGSLKAIYSRSLQSARNLLEGASTIEGSIDLYSEDAGPGKGYADLLAREDVGAVIIALPILIQPPFIRQAIQAGKHVLSEKPIAKDVATALDLLRWYHERARTAPGDRKILWAVGEYIRYQDKFEAAAKVMGTLGSLKRFRVSVHGMVTRESKYYKTEWRKFPEYQGGFVLDGGIHIIGALRYLLSRNVNNDSITTISAHSTLQQPHLAPIDTVKAVLTTKNGATGVLSLSYGSESKDQLFEFCDSDDAAYLGLRVDGDDVNALNVPFTSRGVDCEIGSFLRQVWEGRRVVDGRMSPEEALGDLEVMEKMFLSGERDGEGMGVDYQDSSTSHSCTSSS